jgi:hypothetical protein
METSPLPPPEVTSGRLSRRGLLKATASALGLALLAGLTGSEKQPGPEKTLTAEELYDVDVLTALARDRNPITIKQAVLTPKGLISLTFIKNPDGSLSASGIAVYNVDHDNRYIGSVGDIDVRQKVIGEVGRDHGNTTTELPLLTQGNYTLTGNVQKEKYRANDGNEYERFVVQANTITPIPPSK